MVQHNITVSNILCRGVYVLGAFLVLAKKISFYVISYVSYYEIREP